jgi:hypothetical protein
MTNHSEQVGPERQDKEQDDACAFNSRPGAAPLTGSPRPSHGNPQATR